MNLEYIQSNNVIGKMVILTIALMALLLLVRYLIKDYKFLDPAMWVLVMAICGLAIFDCILYKEYGDLWIVAVVIGGKLFENAVNLLVQKQKERQTKEYGF